MLIFNKKKLDKNIEIHVYLHFILILNNPIYIIHFIITELIKSTYDFTMNGRHSKIFFPVYLQLLPWFCFISNMRLDSFCGFISRFQVQYLKLLQVLILSSPYLSRRYSYAARLWTPGILNNLAISSLDLSKILFQVYVPFFYSSFTPVFSYCMAVHIVDSGKFAKV